MPNFRWPLLFHDIALAKEGISKHPECALDWEGIVTDLSEVFSTKEKSVAIKGRACRERLDLVPNKYREEDSESLKRLVTLCDRAG